MVASTDTQAHIAANPPICVDTMNRWDSGVAIPGRASDRESPI
jgi:hypothetical protein